MIERLKKVRGFKSLNSKKLIINLNDLERNFKEGETVSIQSLIEKKLFSKIEARKGVKILGTGKLTKKIIVDKEILMSESAKKAILK